MKEKRMNQTSIFLHHVQAECFSKATVSKIGEYQEKHSHALTLESEREKFSSATNEALAKIKTFNTLHQVRTHIKNLPFEVQNFIFERIIVMFCVCQYSEKYELSDEELSAPGESIFQLLSPLWEFHRDRIVNLDKIPYDTHLSHIIHRRL